MSNLDEYLGTLSGEGVKRALQREVNHTNQAEKKAAASNNRVDSLLAENARLRWELGHTQARLADGEANALALENVERKLDLIRTVVKKPLKGVTIDPDWENLGT